MSATESLRAYMAQHDPTPTDAEIEAYWISDAPGTTQGNEAGHNFAVADQETANWCLRRIREAEAKVAEIERLASAEVDRIEAWADEECKRPVQTIKYFTDRLQQFHQQVLDANPKAKTLSLPNGKLTARVTPARIEIEDGVDVETVCEQLPSEFVRVKREIDKPSLLKYIKTEGETFYGIRVVPGMLKYTVKTVEVE